MAEKARDAFRTISEVANWLDVPAHVLRFWESKFPQIKPVKRAGGRRYYRPSDMRLIGGIKKLLHDDGLTIRGVQKMLKEDGIKAISELSPALDMPSEEEGAARREARRARRKARKTDREVAVQADSEVTETAAPDEEADEAPFTHVETEEPQTGGDNVVALSGDDAEEDPATEDTPEEPRQAPLDIHAALREHAAAETSENSGQAIAPTAPVPADPCAAEVQSTDAQREAARQMRDLRRIDVATQLSPGGEGAVSENLARLKVLRDRIAADTARR